METLAAYLDGVASSFARDACSVIAANVGDVAHLVPTTTTHLYFQVVATDAANKKVIALAPGAGQKVKRNDLAVTLHAHALSLSHSVERPVLWAAPM
eukprot:160407-Amphidinium_carterae.1